MLYFHISHHLKQNIFNCIAVKGNYFQLNKYSNISKTLVVEVYTHLLHIILYIIILTLVIFFFQQKIFTQHNYK